MKKIGTTDDGDIIVEMTLDEWRITQDKVVEFNDREAWKEDFYNNIMRFDLLPVTRNRLFAEAGISSVKDEFSMSPRRPNRGIFSKDGLLLDFRQWCNMFLAGEISIRMFGKKRTAELEDAIRRYLGK